jgi:hypothetical protein
VYAFYNYSYCSKQFVKISKGIKNKYADSIHLNC